LRHGDQELACQPAGFWQQCIVHALHPSLMT
jgi:hypothetical protein